QLPGVFAVGGLLFLYLSLFASFPAPANGWSPSLRNPVHTGRLAVGVILVAAAAILVILPSWKGLSTELGSSLKLVEGKHHQNGIHQSSGSSDANEHPIVRQWWKLPKTQKEIVVFLYEHSHKSRIAMDDFYKALLGEHGREFVKSPDELFYRLKALRSDGFLDLGAV